MEEDASMLKHIAVLRDINARGYITHDSQAGRKHSGKSPVDGRHYCNEERAYILGFMLESVAAEFLKWMGLHTDKNAVYVPACGGDVSLPVGLDVPLSVDTAGKTPTVYTKMSPVLPVRVWDFYRKEAHINKSEKIVYIFCWDPLWNRGVSGAKGLFTEVLKGLKTVKG